MKHIYICIRLFLAVIMIVLPNALLAQTPPHSTNSALATSSNAFPFNTPTNKKTQFLYRPGDLGSVPGGLIDTIWFRNNNTASGASAGPGTYSNFQLRLGQFTSTVFPGAGSLDFYMPAQLTTVISSPSYTINQTAPNGAWYYIPLPVPFPYDPALTLVVDVEMDNRTSSSGFQSATLSVGSAPNHQRLTSGTNGATSGSASAILSDFGISIAPLLGLDAAAQAIISPAAPLSSGLSTQVTINVQNRGSNNLVSATVGYQLDNNPPVIETWSGNLGGFVSSQHTFALPITVPTTQTFNLKVWVTNANGLGQDLNVTNDTLNRSFCIALPGGTYTIGGPTANFATITDAVNIMNCGGIGGPVVFNINPGTYIGSYNIPNLPGASPSSTITFNSATGVASDVILIQDTATGGNLTNFNIGHTARVSFQNITFRRTLAVTTQAGILSYGNNSGGDVIGCRFEDLTVANSTFNIGVLYNGRGGLIINNSFTGFYYGVFLNGAASNPFVDLNQVLANTFTNYVYRAIYALNQINPVISNNDISNFIGTSTLGSGIWIANAYSLQLNDNLIDGDMSGYAILLSNLNADTTSVQLNTNRIYNNVINGRQAASLSATTTLALNPIHITGSQALNANPPNPRDALEIVNNTVYFELNTTSTSTIQAALYVSGGSATAPAFAFINVRNNHFEVNPIVGQLPATFRLVRFTLIEQLDSLSSSNNNFRIGGSTPPAMFRVNTPATDYATVSAWQTATGKDANSVSINPVFTNTTLLLPTSTAFDNLGTPVSYVFTDFAGQARSATTPDIGAYEFIGRIFSQINVTLLSDTLLGPSRSVVASITDSVSTLIAGSARMFYKKASQSAWQLDTLPVINGTNYRFLINYAALGGVQQMDTIQYYIAVANVTNTVTTAPLSGSGLYLSNAVAPLAPHRYQILPVVNGNYRVGVSGPANFPTITAAANFLTAGLVTGPVTFTLIDSLYSTAETFPITIGQINGSSRTNFVRFVVDSSRSNVAITGLSNSALVILNGARNFEWNGLSPSGARALQVTNTSVAANSCVFNLRSTVSAPLDSVIIQGIRIVGGSNTVTSTFGIHAAGSTVSTATTGDGMNAVRLLNNEVSNTYYGIYLRGSIASPAFNVLIANNRIGSANASTTVNFRGIDVQNLINSQISRNEIFNITGTSAVTRSGIELGGTGSSNVRTTRNLIYDVNTPATSGANGIFVVSGNGFIIDNNVIRGIRTQNGSAISQLSNAFGIRLGSGSGHKVWYNTVHMYGDYANANTTGAASAALVISSTVVTTVEIKNNVFSNTMTSVATGTRAFNAIWLPTSYAPTNLDINNNAYHVSNTVDHAVGRVGTTVTSPLFDDVLAWKGFTSGGAATNDNLSVPPTGKSPAPFVADTVLTIPAATITGIESGAVVVAALGTPNTDFNNISRPAGTGIAPDMGAYEFAGVLLPDAFPPTMDSVNITPRADQCVLTARTITVFARDNSGGVGIDSVMMNWSIDNVAQPRILLTRTAGTAASGTYTGTLPSASAAGQTVRASVFGRDSLANFAPAVALGAFKDDYILISAGNDTTINAGDTATLIASTAFGQSGFLGDPTLAATTNCGGGFMFNMTAVAGSLFITGFDLLPFNATSQTVNVFYKLGGIAGAQGNQALWTQEGTYTIVPANNTAPFNLAINGFTVPAGTVVGVYLQYHSRYATGTTNLSNSDLTITSGEGMCANWTACCSPRLWVGRVYYGSPVTFSWREQGNPTILATTDTLEVWPTVTTNYVLTATDSTCFKTDTVTVFVTPNIIDDIGVSAILTPTAVPALNTPYTVKVVISNLGNAPATGFDVAFGMNGTELNANAIARTVPAGDTIHHTFTQSWSPTTGGTLALCAYTKGLATDVNTANDTSCVTFLNVNVEEVNNLVSKVYPIPADQFVNFDFGAQQGTGTLELRDNLGRLVYSTPIDLSTGSMHEVKTSSYAAGVYNYRFVMDSKVQYGQVVVRR